MNPRKQIFGPLIRPVGDDDKFELLSSTLATNLILFEKFIIHSALLREIPLLVKQFGLEETIALLESGAIEIHSEATQVLSMGSTAEAAKTNRLYEIDISVVVDHDHREAVRQSTERIKSELRLPINDFIRLRAAIVESIDKGIRDGRKGRPEFRAAQGLTNALEANTPTLKFAVAQQLQRRGLATPPETTYKLRMHRHEGDQFSIETDLAKIARCDDATAHDVILQATLSLGGLRSMLEYMAHYEALGTIGEADIPLLSDELQLFAGRLTPQQETVQFSRVVEVAGFPNFGRLAKEGQLRLDKILELRETKEIEEFRNWLPTIADVSEDELRKRVESVTNHVGSFLRSKPGKALRWLATKGIGTVLPETSIPISLANTFLLEKFLPVSGPISFINNKLSSVFELDTPTERADLTLLNLND